MLIWGGCIFEGEIQASTRAVIKSPGKGIVSRYYMYKHDPAYFCRIFIEEKYYQKKSLAVWFLAYTCCLPGRLLEIFVTALINSETFSFPFYSWSMLVNIHKLWIKTGTQDTSVVSIVMSPCQHKNLSQLIKTQLASSAMTRILPIIVRIARSLSVLAPKMLTSVEDIGMKNALFVHSRIARNHWYVNLHFLL